MVKWDGGVVVTNSKEPFQFFRGGSYHSHETELALRRILHFVNAINTSVAANLLSASVLEQDTSCVSTSMFSYFISFFYTNSKC